MANKHSNPVPRWAVLGNADHRPRLLLILFLSSEVRDFDARVGISWLYEADPPTALFSRKKEVGRGWRHKKLHALPFDPF